MDAELEDQEIHAKPARSNRRLWSALLSAFVPGLGDWFVGRSGRGTVFLAFFAVLELCYWPLHLAKIFAGLVFLIYAGLALNLSSGCVTLLSKRESAAAAANWWVLLVIPIALSW
jgi:hypothetical protein